MSRLGLVFTATLGACLCSACSSSAAIDAAPADAAPPDATPIVFTPLEGTTTVVSATTTLAGRTVLLFAPAFDYDRARAYILVLNDGQDINALGLAATLDDLWKRQLLQPMVVAAVPAGDRLQDYGTAEHDVSIACISDPGGQPLGTKAGDYARWVKEQLVPAAAAATGITPAPARTGILGASLGGLSAFSIAWDHPEVFGFAGAMSGSFWWRADPSTLETRQNSRIMQAIVARSTARPGFRAWFEAGTKDETADRDGDGIIDAIDDTLDLIAAMQGLGYRLGVDIVYDQIEGGIHGYSTWKWVLLDFLSWAAGA